MDATCRNIATADRDQAILSMRNNRDTYAQIGERFSISANRARQIYFKQVRLQKEKKEKQETQDAWTDPLPLGFQQWFEQLGLRRKEEVFEAVKDGRIAERRNEKDRYYRITAHHVLNEPTNGWLRPADMKLVVEWVGLAIGDYVVPKNEKELRRFLGAVKSGLPVGDAIQKHFFGPRGGKRRMVMDLLKAVTALEAPDLENLRRWVTEDPNWER